MAEAKSTAAPAVSGPAQYDLTHKMAPFLDPHLAIPLVMHLRNCGAHNTKDLLAAELDLVGGTSMVDYEMEIYQQLHGTDAPKELDDKREEFFQKFGEVEHKVDALRTLLIDQEEEVNKMREDEVYNRARLEDLYGVSEEQVEALFDFGKVLFDQGSYNESWFFLGHYLLLTDQRNERAIQALWGKLCAEILDGVTKRSAGDEEGATVALQNAMADLNQVVEQVDNRNIHPLLKLQSRAWLLHWSLFIYFNTDNGLEELVKFFNVDMKNDRGEKAEKRPNRDTILTYTPWLLRYLAVAIVSDKDQWHSKWSKNLGLAIAVESYEYSDPITEFVFCLLREFDFQSAQEKLAKCEEVLSNDFFLVNHRDIFMSNAREFIFETYCSIHLTIDIDMLATNLNLDKEAAERWVIDLIDVLDLKAKIDSASSHVEMETRYPSIYQQIQDKTRELSRATFRLADNVREYYNECKTQYRATIVANQHAKAAAAAKNQAQNRANGAVAQKVGAPPIANPGSA